MPHHIHQQTFQYDALGNITSCTTQFVEGGQNTATYTYERSAGRDPCQLKSVAHTHADYPKQIALTYDTAGRLQADEHSRTLSYDACGRLASIAASTSLPAASYQYDAFDCLVEQTIGADTTSLYYRASALVNQLTGTDTSQHQRFIGGGIAQSTNETAPKTWLTGSDSQRNVLLTEQGGERETQTYSPYGDSPRDTKAHSKLGYTGERRDPASGVYHLGNGYRSYSPVLMRFTAPDSWSPFGAGGINPYAYCAGDPINRADPSGHMSLGGWIGLGLGIVGGIAVGILTEGAALPAVASLIATAVADATVGVATQMITMAIDRERLDSLGAGGWGAIIGLSVAGTLGGFGLAKGLTRATAGLRKRLGNLKGGMLDRGRGGWDAAEPSTSSTEAVARNQIGRGAQAVVFDLGNGFVVKEFHETAMISLNRLEKETNIFNIMYGDGAAIIELPNKIKMRKIPGVPISQYGPSRLTPKQTDALIDTIKSMHEKNVLHSDLHNSNILFDETNNNFNIIDFGASTHPALPKHLNEEMNKMVFTVNQWLLFNKRMQPKAPSVLGRDARVFI